MGRKPGSKNKVKRSSSKKKNKPGSTEFTASNTANSVTDSEADPHKDVENYNVMYSKHLKQNVKTWEEGLLCFHPKNCKVSLFTRTSRAKNVEWCFLKYKPDFVKDEEIRLTKHLVMIEVS